MQRTRFLGCGYS